MSIFSKLLKRGAEEGGPATAERGEPPAAEVKPPAARAEAAAPTPAAPSTKAAGPAPVTHAAPAARPASAPVKGPAPAPAQTPSAARPAAPKPVPAAAAPPVVSPSPKPATVPARAANGHAAEPKARPAPAPVADAVVAMEAEPSSSVDAALAGLTNGAGPGAARPPAAELTVADLQAVLATFEDLAVGHSAEVRNLMMEVRWGEAQTSWFELARPALKSLRAMAGQVGHVALGAALDGFGAAVDEALRPGAAPSVGPAMRDKLLAAYAPLVTALPSAFDLQGERDRREPLVVRALLGQVAGLEPLMIEKMIGAGLGRLDPLLKARADEVAAVAGLASDVAAAVVARVQAWKRETPAALATPDRNATARELVGLVRMLEGETRAFEDASRGWSEADRDAKKRLRRQREVTFLQITIVLARLGEVDLALMLEKLSFARRLEELGRLVSRFPPALLSAPTSESPVRKIERDVPSGAHAAP